jgi:hypothetical protein
MLKKIDDLETSKNESVNIRDLKEELLPRWWKQSLCLKGLCKYVDGPVTRSFTGI